MKEGIKVLLETLRIVFILSVLSFGLLVVLKISAPQPPNSSGVEY
jgi:hypothetical protein